MNRNFQRALTLVLKSEGGYVNDPHDPGGATNKGVTIATFRRYVDQDGTIADLKALTVEQAGIVYRKQYWDAVRGDELPDGVDYAVFDFAVNSGPGRAAKYLQATVGAAPDGSIGPATLKAVKAKSPDVIIDTLCDKRRDFLEGLAGWTRFGKGWSSRVKSVRAEAKAMSEQA
jgi:lysozyme family protein